MCDPFHPPAMSGEIFQPLETFEEQVESGRGPLTCRLCTQQYEDPRILNCHHVFCGNCLRGRAVDGFMTCPLCGTRTFLTSGSNLPPTDPVINFLLKSSEQERALCANCDTMQASMFFCNTCNQALCASCKEETHMAKMFASHKLVSLKKRTKEQHRKCAKHNDEYIMYSTEKQELLCIKCFRDFEKDDRAFCLDLESAYNQSCRQLEERISTIRDLQSSVHDAIILFQALMQEVKSNAEKERVSIQELCAEMQKRMMEKKEELLKDVDSQQIQKEQAFKDQLPSLAALLPSLQTYLAISTMFVNNANMYEFLDLSSSLNERLESIASQPHQLRPQESGEISTDYESKFARCLQPLLRIHLDDCGDCGSSSPIIHVSMPTTSSPPPQHPQARISEYQAAQPLSSAYISSALARHLSLTNTLQDPLTGKGLRRGSKMTASIRHRMQEGNGPFVEHCKAFEANFRLLQHRIQKMKEQVQEIHRDITRRKCLAKKEKVMDVLDECSQVEIQISTHTATLEHMKVIFQKIWQEMLDRVSSEQEIYQSQLKDMNYLKQENSHLATIARQIAPYITSIDTVTKQIDPRRATDYDEKREVTRSRSTSPHGSDDEETDCNPVHVSKLVLANKTGNSISDSSEVVEREPDTNSSLCLGSPDSTLDKSLDAHCSVSHDACRSSDTHFPGDGEETKKARHRTLSEQEEFERLRAKKIVMDAILSEQCKEALKETGESKGQEPDFSSGTGQGSQTSKEVEERQRDVDADRGFNVTKLDPDHPCGSLQRPHSGKGLEEPKKCVDVDKQIKVANALDCGHSCGSSQRLHAVKGLEETQKHCSSDRQLNVVDVTGNSNSLNHELGVVKRRVKRERRVDEGIVHTTTPEADAEEGGVSVSSRVKRFSLSDDQMEMAQKQAGACPSSPCSPRAQNDAKRVIVKRNDAEVKQRSVMSVTVTTTEDNTTHTLTNGNSIEHSKRPITDETESVVWRVRNRRKLREQASLAKNS